MENEQLQPSPIRLFVSHASANQALGKRIVELLQVALNLPETSIRFTSVDRYGLPGGADIDEQLRTEISAATAFIGIVSHEALRSTYVLFELGARWATRQHLLPLLAPGTSSSELRGPLAGYHALRADHRGELHRLINDLAQVLNITAEPAAVYEEHLERVLAPSAVTTHFADVAERGIAMPPPIFANFRNKVL
jgi:hypothetical protein